MKRRRAPHALRTIAQRFGLNLMYVFGSQARGDAHSGSDLDIAYQSDQPLSFARQSELSHAISRVPAFSRGPIDLVELNSVPPLLGYQIALEGKRTYGDDRADEAFYRRSLKRYIDAKPIFIATAEYVHQKTGFKNSRSSEK